MSADKQVRGRVLYLTADLDLLDQQLAGSSLTFDPNRPLLDNISTDEIVPAWTCFHFDEQIARFCLIGLRGGRVREDAIRTGGFDVIVSGMSKGCGSSREQAPFAELAAGVRIVVARSFEKIYQQNAQNIGLLTTADFSVLDLIDRGEPISIHYFTRGLDPISAAIVEAGGLFAYNRARLEGSIAPPAVVTPRRAMTLCEKILASHAVLDATSSTVGCDAVQPGDAIFARCDVRFSHEYVTPMSEALLARGVGEGAALNDPSSITLFRDHLTFLDQVMPEAHRQRGLDMLAANLATAQETFATKHGLSVIGEVTRDGVAAGSEAICHNKIFEQIALPGQVVIGTDSHTCMAGAIGCLAFGVGATDMANAWFTRDVRVRVPETVRVVLSGALRPGVAAKDVMLHLLSLPFVREGSAIGKVLQFSGEAVEAWSVDERATLTNMAVEGGGFTGIVEADEVVVRAICELRGIDEAAVRQRIVRGDPDAQFAATIAVDVGSIEPMVALPGDPRNGIPLSRLADEVRIDIAYGGSCTGGKKADMDMYAAVLAQAVAQGKRVADGVAFYIQFGSQHIRDYAQERGYLEVFRRAGAMLLDPSCGACIAAGPGISRNEDQVTVSAVNRNFPGRSGPGKVYLASPYVVAASAIAGRIAAFE